MTSNLESSDDAVKQLNAHDEAAQGAISESTAKIQELIHLFSTPAAHDAKSTDFSKFLVAHLHQRLDHKTTLGFVFHNRQIERTAYAQALKDKDSGMAHTVTHAFDSATTQGGNS